MRRLIFIICLITCKLYAGTNYYPVSVDTDTRLMYPARSDGSYMNFDNSSRTNTVLVRSLSDFPTPTNGVIITGADVAYEINGRIPLGTNRIVIGSSGLLYGIDKSSDGLLYTGTGSMITISNLDASVKSLLAYAPLGTAVELFGTNGARNQSEIYHMIFNNCSTILKATDFYRIIYHNNLDVSSLTGVKHKFIGTNFGELVFLDNIFDNYQTNVTWVALGTGVWNYVEISRIHSHIGTNSLFLTGLTNSGNISSFGYGFLNDLSFHAGAVTIPDWTNIATGIVSEDIRWSMDSVQGASSSAANGGMYATNQMAMLPLAPGTNTVITGYWTPTALSRFTFSTNRLTYIGAGTLNYVVTVMAALDAPSGNNQNITCGLLLNGVPVSFAQNSAFISSGNPISAPFVWLVTLKTGDYLQLFIRNDTSNKGATLKTCQLTVR